MEMYGWNRLCEYKNEQSLPFSWCYCWDYKVKKTPNSDGKQGVVG